MDTNWRDLRTVRGAIYREFMRRDAIEAKGILPHIGQYNKIKKRMRNINKALDYSQDISPNHSLSKEKSILYRKRTSGFN